MSDELKACPFCGKKASLWFESEPEDQWRVWCSDPNCSYEHPLVTVHDWNKRPIEDVLHAEIARLREALETIIAETDNFPFKYRSVFEEIGVVDYPSVNRLHTAIKTLSSIARTVLAGQE